MSKRQRTALLWLIPALLIATWLAARSLNTDLVWIDELMSIGNIGGLRKIPFNPLEVAQSIRIQSPQHVPGYFILLSGWAGLVGWQPAALRALSVFFSLLAIAWTYRLGRDHISPQVGLFAAILLSVSAFLVNYSHELRMYTLVAALSAFTIWIYLRVIDPRHEPTKLAWLGLLAGAVGLLYTHYWATLPLFAIGLYHLFFVRKNRRWWRVLGVMFVAGLTFLPWLPVFIYGFTDVTARRSDLRTNALPPVDLLQSLASLFSNGAILLLVIVLVFSVIAYRRDKRRLWLLLLLLIGVTMIFNATIGMITTHRTRYLIDVWPLLAVVAGLGLAEIQRRWRLAWPVILIWVVGGIAASGNPNFLADIDGPRQIAQYPPLREMAGALENVAGQDDLIVGVSRSADIYTLYKIETIGEYYLSDLHVDYFFIGIDDWRSPAPDLQKQALREQMADRLHLWLAYEPDKVPAETIADYGAILESQYQPCATLLNQPDLRIERYDRRDFGCLSDTRPQTTLAQFGDGIALADLKVKTQPDGSLAVAAAWDVAETVPPETYSVSFKVRDENNDYLAQDDDGLRPAGFGWQLAIIPLDDPSPGPRQLTVTVYDWRTGVTLTGTLMATGTTGDILPVDNLQ